MSVKDGLKYVKQELSGDEKALESVFKLERFYKKHKYKIFALLALIIVAVLFNIIGTQLKQNRLEKANTAYMQLQQDSSDTAALEALKENNKALYDLFVYRKASAEGDTKTLESLKSSENKLVVDLSVYTEAMLNKTPKDSLIFADYSKLAQAYELMKKGENKQGADILSTIDAKSPAAMIALLMKHSMIKGEK
ncbi:MAG: hypothetical protein JXQ68_07505 [Campylobacterales bacterium]|nr:hypothetical protein [Campylobacterales bacterium]